MIDQLDPRYHDIGYYLEFFVSGGYGGGGYDATYDDEYPAQQQPYPHPGIRGLQYGGDGRQYPAGGGQQWSYDDRYAHQAGLPDLGNDNSAIAKGNLSVTNVGF